jgi:hypothetical protein
LSAIPSLSISEDSKGRLWLGTDDGAVSRFENNGNDSKFSRFDALDEFGSYITFGHFSQLMRLITFGSEPIIQEQSVSVLLLKGKVEVLFPIPAIRDYPTMILQVFTKTKKVIYGSAL